MNTPSIEVRNDEFLRNGWLQARCFTDNARLMLKHALSRATNRGMFGFLPAVAVLWAMLRWERKVGIVVLEICGVDLKLLEQDVEDVLRSCPTDNWRDGVDCSRIGAVAVLAVEEAAAIGHNYVGTEHVVLAMCRMDDEVIARLFAKHNISHEQYRQRLLELLDRDCSSHE